MPDVVDHVTDLRARVQFLQSAIFFVRACRGESSRSPRGFFRESPGIPQGFPRESSRSLQGVLRLLRDSWDSSEIPGTPQRFLRDSKESLGSPQRFLRKSSESPKKVLRLLRKSSKIPQGLPEESLRKRGKG
jgi:hypothetical protein